MQIDNSNDIETVLKALLVAVDYYQECEDHVATGNIGRVYWEKQKKRMQDTYDRLIKKL